MTRGIMLSAFVVVVLVGRWVEAQVVQLPTFTQFHVTTTVSVPDSGGAYLGGIKRLREGSTTRGVPGLGQVPMLGRLFKNRGIGREAGSSGVSVHAQILDREELEAELARQASRPGQVVNPRMAHQANFISRHVARHVPRPEPKVAEQKQPSLEEIRRENALAAEKRYQEAERFFRLGEAAEADGKRGAAKIFYQMAARRTEGNVQRLILARLERLLGQSHVASK